EDIHSDQPADATARRLRSKELAFALTRLNPRMRRVLALRFGLDGQQPQTLEEVGAGLGITRERVRQLESRALRELRMAAPDLELYLRAARDAIRGQTQLELRVGFELTPDRALLREDPARYRLEGTDFVLMEVPFHGPAELLWALAEHVEQAGFEPVIAHPERTECVLS